MKNVRRLIGGSGFEHFTALETLKIEGIIPRFCIKEEEDEDEDGDNSCLFSKSFPPNLRKLEFKCLQEEISLPEGMQYLTSLQTLRLVHCYKLEGLPDWIDCLSSLQSLYIEECPGIKSIPAPMQKLTQIEFDLFTNRDGWSMAAIPRRNNRIADQLAKDRRNADLRTDSHVFLNDPPVAIHELHLLDLEVCNHLNPP